MSPNQLSVAFTEAGICAHCKKVCMLPGQSPMTFAIETGITDALRHPGRYRLRVVKLKRNDADDHIHNLKPLCVPCALRFWTRYRKRPLYPTRRRYL